MAHYTVEVVHESSRSIREIFGKLSDHGQLRRVFGVPVRRIHDADGGDVNGVGSVRKIGVGPLGIEETVTALVPDQMIEYRITRGGGPVKNHIGKVLLDEVGSGCRVRWTIHFDSFPVVGSALEAVLGRVIARGLRRI